jgi:hypothetical protein
MRKLLIAMGALTVLAGCTTQSSIPTAKNAAAQAQAPVVSQKSTEVSSTSSASVAVLTANDPNSRINLSATPSTTGKSLGYGLVGDRVSVINKVTVEEYTWYQVRFPRSGAIGWIREDFVNESQTELPVPSSSPESSFDGTKCAVYSPGNFIGAAVYQFKAAPETGEDYLYVMFADREGVVNQFTGESVNPWMTREQFEQFDQEIKYSELLTSEAYQGLTKLVATHPYVGIAAKELAEKASPWWTEPSCFN